MKQIAFILLVVIAGCSSDKMSTKKIGERVTKIRAELLNRKELPASIERTDGDMNGPMGLHSYSYRTTRKLEGMGDSIAMNIIIDPKDTSGRVEFMEAYTKQPNDTPRYRNGEGKDVFYSVDKTGIIDMAYYIMPPTEEMKITYNEDGSMSTPARDMITEICLHPQQWDTLKIPDAKTAEFYNARLLTSLNELEKILFVK